jgi:predicted RNA-binding Zn ribbon-like protein
MARLAPTVHKWQAKDLVGGDPALDFANTVSGWGTDYEDWLSDYAGLAQWAQLAGLIGAEEHKQAARMAAANPAAAERVYAEMAELRLAFIRTIHATIGRRNATGSDLATIDRWVKTSAVAFELRQSAGAFHSEWGASVSALEKPLLSAGAAIGRFLFEAEFEKLKLCALPTCGWLFIDVSKNGRRRWCDMSVCGNLAKARRFQARRRV